MVMSEILQDLAKAGQSGERVMIVFDLDSTLLKTDARMTLVMREFALNEAAAEAFPEECKILEVYEHNPMDYGLMPSLERIGLAGAPYDFYCSLQDYWGHKFFSSELLHVDEPYEGAVEFVQKICSEGCHIGYLTARDKKRMEEGTLESLKNLEFPIDKPNIQLFLKPAVSGSDRTFKKEVLDELAKTHGPLWFFENEPTNINSLLKSNPDIKVIFLDTVHSGRESKPKGVAYLKNFERSG